MCLHTVSSSSSDWLTCVLTCSLKISFLINYRSYSVIRRTVFSRKICLGWQVSAKIGVRLIAKYYIFFT